MIFAAYFLYDMCFPNGAQASEDSGRGKSYKLKLINTKIVEK